MNHRLVLHNSNDNDDDEVQIQVKRKEDSDDAWSETMVYPPGEVTTVVMRVVPTTRRRDFQYVVQTKTTADTSNNDAEDVGLGAQFTEPRMCEGRRSFGVTGGGGGVTLEIDGTRPTVELEAAYAAGHEAVKLTAVTVLRRQEASRGHGEL